MGFLSFGEGSFLLSLVTDMVAGTLFGLRAISSKSRRRPKDELLGIPFSLINYAAHCTAWLSYGKKLAEAMSGWMRKHWLCITSPRGGGWAENPSRLTGLRIFFEMPRVYENRSWSKEILHVVIHHFIMHRTIHKRSYVAHAFWNSAA